MKNVISKKHTKNLSLPTKIGIFAGSLLFAALAVYIYSPILGTSAEETSTTDVNVRIAPIISLSLDTNALNFSITPTSSGVFDSKPIVATVDTNSTGGYELYFSSIDDQTSMTSLTSESTITSTFANTVTSTTMTNNTWGYSLDNTDFSKIPTLTNHVALKNLDHLPTAAEKVTTTNIGVKIDSTLASGTYNKKVLFSAVAHPSLSTISSLTSMQEMDTATCEHSVLNESATLQDTRDGNYYSVAKLADGRCWMTSDLMISGTTLHPSDSDVSEDFNLPSTTLSGFVYTTDNTIDVFIDEDHNIGYYSWLAATAGTGAKDLTSGAAPSSICPKGWRLPTGSVDDEFDVLVKSYSGSTVTEFINTAGFSLNGYVINVFNNGAKLEDYGGTSYYWTSTAENTYAHDLYIDYAYHADGYMSTGMRPKNNSGTIHCIAK